MCSDKKKARSVNIQGFCILNFYCVCQFGVVFLTQMCGSAPIQNMGFVTEQHFMSRLVDLQLMPVGQLFPRAKAVRYFRVDVYKSIEMK